METDTQKRAFGEIADIEERTYAWQKQLDEFENLSLQSIDQFFDRLAVLSTGAIAFSLTFLSFVTDKWGDLVKQNITTLVWSWGLLSLNAILSVVLRFYLADHYLARREDRLLSNSESITKDLNNLKKKVLGLAVATDSENSSVKSKKNPRRASRILPKALVIVTAFTFFLGFNYIIQFVWSLLKAL